MKESCYRDIESSISPELIKRGFSFNFSKMRTSVFVVSLSLTMVSASSAVFISESNIFATFLITWMKQTTKSTLLVWQPSLCLNCAHCLPNSISCVFFTDRRYQLIQKKQKLSTMTHFLISASNGFKHKMYTIYFINFVIMMIILQFLKLKVELFFLWSKRGQKTNLSWSYLDSRMSFF